MKKIFTSLFVLILTVSPTLVFASGATLDAHAEGDNTTSPKTLTIASTADLATLSIVGSDNATNVCTATLGGFSMTQAVRQSDTTLGVSETVLYLYSPGSGSKTLVVSGCTSYTYTLNSYITGGMLLHDSGSATSGSANHINVSVTLTYTDSLVVFSCQGTGGTNEACNQSYAGHPRYGGGTYSLDQTPAGSTSVSLGFGGQTWTASGAVVAAFSVTPPPPYYVDSNLVHMDIHAVLLYMTAMAVATFCYLMMCVVDALLSGSSYRRSKK